MSAPIPFRQLAVLRIGPVLSDEQQGLTYQVGRQGVKAIAYLPEEHGFEVEGDEREGYWIPVANVVWGRKLKAATEKTSAPETGLINPSTSSASPKGCDTASHVDAGLTGGRPISPKRKGRAA